MTVVRLHSKNRCYLMPMTDDNDQLSSSIGRPLELINRQLDEELVLELVGHDGLEFCKDQEIYLLRDPNKVELIRRKRQAEEQPAEISEELSGKNAEEQSAETFEKLPENAEEQLAGISKTKKPKENTEKQPIETFEELTEESLTKTSEELPGKNAEEQPAEISEELPEENAEEQPVETFEELTEESLTKTSEELPGKNAEEQPAEISEELPEKNAEEQPVETFEELTEESLTKTSEELPAKISEDDNAEESIEETKQASISAVSGHRASGLDLEYDKRKPRCMDLVLDCSDGVGEEQGCYTWINGVIQMKQTCLSATEFKVSMVKPMGRMLKIAQQQWKICLRRRKEGKRC